MSRFNKFASFVAVTLLLSACAEREIVQDPTDSPAPIVLYGEVAQQYVTRAADGGFADGDRIGVFVVNRDDGVPGHLCIVGNHADNVRFIYDAASGTWTGSYQLYWKDKLTHVDAYGYYPFDENMHSVEDYPFQIFRNQRDVVSNGSLTGYEASDFLWAKAEDVAPGMPIYLKHQHLMAGVQVTLVEGDGFDAGEWDAASKTVLVENTATSTYINIGSGTVGVSRTSAVETIIPQERGAVWRAVVAPQTVAAEASLLAITVDGVSYSFTRTNAMAYQSGKLHKFTIKVDKRMPEGTYAFSLVSESISPWENDSESHNGTAREYVTVHVEEGQFLGNVIDSLGIDPSSIVNLKLTGTLTGREQYLSYDNRNGDANFLYICFNMKKLEAINMKELRTKNMISYERWEGPHYGQPLSADDYIPQSAFETLETLSYVVFPDSLKGIGQMAFYRGPQLRGSLVLPEGLRYIGGSAFDSQQLLTGNLYIPASVEYIGDGAFWDCSFTSELVLPERMCYLGKGAFWGCCYMTGSIHIPEGLDEVNNSWEYTEIGGPATVPQGVKKYNPILSPITSLFLPEGVEEIGGVWEDWRTDGPNGSYRVKLMQVSIPSTVRKIGENAFAGTGISRVTLPEGMEMIESGTFANSYLQDTIVIPSTVKQIRSDAFAGCRMLNAVVLPAGLEGIQEGAFRDCFSLDYIQCLGPVPPVIADNSFSGVEKNNFTVVVPENAVEAYKNADGWREFKRISAYRNFVCRPMKAKLLNKSNVRDIVLNADESWTVKSCPSWVHLDKSSGYKKTELKATIDALPHGADNREGSVVFQLNRKDEDGNPITCSFQVQQFDYEIDEDATVTFQRASKGQRGGIDILFVGDGYDAEDIASGTYRQDMEQEMEYFFGVEPYKTYRDYFNVHAAMALSYESGVVDSPDKWRNTKFGITYGAGDNGRLLVDFDGIAGYVLGDVSDCPVTENNFGRSLVVCVPNSDAYEGLCSMYGDGSAIAVCPHSTWDYPHDARGIIQHEAGGHGWGKLDDEYIYHRGLIQTCNCVCCSHVDDVLAMQAMGWGRNLSLSGKYKEVPWSHLIFDPRYGDIVDIYEGGHMHSDGIYRSEVNSCMNNNVPYFSSWSRQIIVERIMWAAGETFDFETFVSKDSREMGSKFLTRGDMDGARDTDVKAVHSGYNRPVIRKGSPSDYIRKR